MAIDMNKPEPLDLGGHLHYTLSSYEPVSVEITTARTAEADVDFALERICFENGIKREDVTDELVKERFDLEGIEAAKKLLRTQLEQANAAQAEQQKQVACVEELAKRLEQQVPAASVSQFKSLLESSIAHDAQHMQMDAEQLKQISGITEASLLEMAEVSATQEAALSAYADEKKLEVTEDEVPDILGGTAEQIKPVIEEARKNKQLDKLLQDLRPRKAAREVMNDAKITYQLESESLAEKRAAQYPELIELMHKQLSEQGEKCCGGHGHGNGECCGGEGHAHGHGNGECCGGEGHAHGHGNGECCGGEGHAHDKDCKCKNKE